MQSLALIIELAPVHFWCSKIHWKHVTESNPIHGVIGSNQCSLLASWFSSLLHFSISRSQYIILQGRVIVPILDIRVMKQYLLMWTGQRWNLYWTSILLHDYIFVILLPSLSASNLLEKIWIFFGIKREIIIYGYRINTRYQHCKEDSKVVSLWQAWQL